MPRQVLTAPQGASVTPDLPNWAWHEYGMRVGFWRLKAALDSFDIAPTLAINGAVPAAYPRVTRPPATRGGSSWCMGSTKWRHIWWTTSAR